MGEPAAAPGQETKALLDSHDPEYRTTPVDVSPWTKLTAVAALVPIIDLVTDMALFAVLLDAAWTGWALLVLLVFVLFLRFYALYSALTPAPDVSNYILMYIPFLALPYFADIDGHASGDIVQNLYERAGILSEANASTAVSDPEAGGASATRLPPAITAGAPAPTTAAAAPPPASPGADESVPTPPPSPPPAGAPDPAESVEPLVSSNKPQLYGGQPADFYEFLFDAHGDMAKFGGGRLGRLYFIITHEIEVTFVSLFLGPILLFDTCTRMAVERIRKTPAATLDGGMRRFHEEVVEVLPAGFSSLLQLAVTFTLSITMVLHPGMHGGAGGVNIFVLGASILSSVLSLNLGMYEMTG